MKIKKIKNGFTLVEIMVGIMIVSIVILGGFQALSSITVGKARIIQEVDIQKESFYFTEKLFEMIKKGGTIDYEEYFNRRVNGNTTYSSGYFEIATGFGNFGKAGTVFDNIGSFTSFGGKFYKCLSKDGDKMNYDGCVTDYNVGASGYNGNYDGTHQRYGQYSYQFIDYNSNYDDDLGDEDGDGDIVGDDDDEYIGDGPEIFSSGAVYPELYLISGDKLIRTYFRWSVRKDENAPASTSCGVNSSTNIVTGTGCIGTVEYIKLLGKDWGLDHDYNLDDIDGSQYDGVIDTWVIDPEFNGGVIDEIAGVNKVPWVKLFSDSINVSEFKVYAYPNKDIGNSWKNTDESINISPYVIVNLKIKPSWLSRKKIGGEGKELEYSMTINLSDIYSK